MIKNIINRLSTAYNKAETSNNYKFLKVFADELAEIEQLLEDIKNSHFVDTATGINLDRIGALVGEKREYDNDEDYRARIKTKYSRLIADGTKSAIRFALSTLGIDPNRIEFIEEFPNQPAHFTLRVPTDYGDKELLIVEIVDRTKGAGISWQIWWLGSKWDEGKWDEGVWGS
jgi:hypothetical protein